MMRVAEARARFARARVARLTTATLDAVPHVVPICFAVDGDVVYSAIDRKPKRTLNLKRLRNAVENPRVAVLADHYDDADWSALWWVRGDGTARVLRGSCEESELAMALLLGRYHQYRAEPPAGPILAVDVERWTGWSAACQPRAT